MRANTGASDLPTPTSVADPRGEGWIKPKHMQAEIH